MFVDQDAPAESGRQTQLLEVLSPAGIATEACEEGMYDAPGNTWIVQSYRPVEPVKRLIGFSPACTGRGKLAGPLLSKLLQFGKGRIAGFVLAARVMDDGQSEGLVSLIHFLLGLREGFVSVTPIEEGQCQPCTSRCKVRAQCQRLSEGLNGFIMPTRPPVESAQVEEVDRAQRIDLDCVLQLGNSLIEAIGHYILRG